MAERTIETAQAGRHLEPDQDWHRPGVAGLAVLGMLAVCGVGVAAIGRGARPLPDVARQALVIALPKWDTTEPVNEIVYGSRGWDTFGETFLLLAAVTAVVVLSRRREPRSGFVGEAQAGKREQGEADPRPGDDRGERQARSAEEQEADGHSAPMTVVVQYAARIAAVLLGVAGIYLAAWGYTPGGGFPAGAIVAGLAILLYTAFGYERISAVVRPERLEPAEMLGAALIIAVGLGGLIAHGEFLANWLPLTAQQTILAGGTLQAFSGAEIIEVATGLGIAVFALLAMGHDWTPDEDANEHEDEDGS